MQLVGIYEEFIRKVKLKKVLLSASLFSGVYLSLRRPLSAAVDTVDDSEEQSPAVMWGSLILTAIITTVLVLVLALCTCGKKASK